MARIVILGAGIGGVPVAYERKELAGKKRSHCHFRQSDVSFRALESLGGGQLAEPEGHQDRTRASGEDRLRKIFHEQDHERYR